MTRRPATAEFF